MALYGGLVGAAPLGGSRGTHLPLLKTALQQKKPAALRILPMSLRRMVSLRSGSSSFVDLGRLRFEAVELTNRGRLSGGALSSKCSVVLSMETLRWVFTVSALVLRVQRTQASENHFLFRYWPWRHLRRLCRGSEVIMVCGLPFWYSLFGSSTPFLESWSCLSYFCCLLLFLPTKH